MFPIQNHLFLYSRRSNCVLPESLRFQVSGFFNSSRGFRHANRSPEAARASSAPLSMPSATELTPTTTSLVPKMPRSSLPATSSSASTGIRHQIRTPQPADGQSHRTGCRPKPGSPSSISMSVPSKKSKPRPEPRFAHDLQRTFSLQRNEAEIAYKQQKRRNEPTEHSTPLLPIA